MAEMLARKGNLQHAQLVHQHKEVRARDLGRYLLVAPPWVVLSLGLVMYVTLAVVFAGLFTACSEECFDGLTGDFGFVPMLPHLQSVFFFGKTSRSVFLPRATISLYSVHIKIDSGNNFAPD